MIVSSGRESRSLFLLPSLYDCYIMLFSKNAVLSSSAVWYRSNSFHTLSTMMVIAGWAEIKYENKLYAYIFVSFYKDKCASCQCVCVHMCVCLQQCVWSHRHYYWYCCLKKGCVKHRFVMQCLEVTLTLGWNDYTADNSFVGKVQQKTVWSMIILSRHSVSRWEESHFISLLYLYILCPGEKSHTSAVCYIYILISFFQHCRFTTGICVVSSLLLQIATQMFIYFSFVFVYACMLFCSSCFHCLFQ